MSYAGPLRVAGVQAGTPLWVPRSLARWVARAAPQTSLSSDPWQHRAGQEDRWAVTRGSPDKAGYRSDITLSGLHGRRATAATSLRLFKDAPTARAAVVRSPGRSWLTGLPAGSPVLCTRGYYPLWDSLRSGGRSCQRHSRLRQSVGSKLRLGACLLILRATPRGIPTQRAGSTAGPRKEGD